MQKMLWLKSNVKVMFGKSRIIATIFTATQRLDTSEVCSEFINLAINPIQVFKPVSTILSKLANILPKL